MRLTSRCVFFNALYFADDSQCEDTAVSTASPSSQTSSVAVSEDTEPSRPDTPGAAYTLFHQVVKCNYSTYRNTTY